jgi:hypothetical protein
MDAKVSRRTLLRQAAALGAFALVGAACSKQPASLTCTDTTGLSPADVTVRTTLVYLDTSLEPGRTCSNCQQFIPGAPNACGTCKILKGPINPKGSCKSYVAKPT